MSVLYLDLGMGAAGDMLTSALLELFDDPGAELEKLNSLGFDNVKYMAERSEKCGIGGTHISVLVDGAEEHVHDHHVHDHHHDHDHEHDHHHEHDHEHEHDHHHDHDHTHTHEHHGIKDIEHIVKDHLNLSDKVKEDVLNVFNLIAEAESHVHGVPVTDIHFHEVGTMDAVADVAAVCFLMNELSPSEVVSSTVHVGFGTVRCAHGLLPVPAPATAYILKGIPMYAGKIEGELCTPTGAALIKYFTDRFDVMPAMSVTKIGYGMGKKDFEKANCVRAMLGENVQKAGTDKVSELSVNLDDMTAEEIAYAVNILFESGALDVYTQPIGMKKNRPGTKISVLCRPEDEKSMVDLLFKHTTTLGVRKVSFDRFVLDREVKEIQTELGPIRKKISTGYGVTKEKYEYEDIVRLAKESDLSIKEVKDKL